MFFIKLRKFLCCNEFKLRKFDLCTCCLLVDRTEDAGWLNAWRGVATLCESVDANRVVGFHRCRPSAHAGSAFPFLLFWSAHFLFSLNQLVNQAFVGSSLRHMCAQWVYHCLSRSHLIFISILIYCSKIVKVGDRLIGILERSNFREITK